MHLKEMAMRRREVWTEKIDNGNGKRSDAERPVKSGLTAPEAG